MSVITGDAVRTIRNLDDKEVLQQCMAVLRELFKEQVGFFLRDDNIHSIHVESRDFPGLLKKNQGWMNLLYDLSFSKRLVLNLVHFYMTCLKLCLFLAH